MHGDDFVTLGPIHELRKFSQELKAAWMIEERGVFGPPESRHLGTVQEMRHLNRILKWTDEGISYEADPRHVDIVVKALGVSKAVTTPLVREPPDNVDVKDKMLSEQEATFVQVVYYEDWIYIPRPDRFATSDERTGKGHVSAYGKAHGIAQKVQPVPPTLTSSDPNVRRQRILTRLDVYSDSDHAGCIRTRKSTSGCVIMAGCNLLKSVCRGQAVVALSSGEAEFYALLLQHRKLCVSSPSQVNGTFDYRSISSSMRRQELR